MKRHCPRCGKPEAIVVTSQAHATRMGKVEEENWRCEDCFFHFKLHSPKWDAFWILFAVVMVGAGIAAFAGLVKTKPDERTLMGVILVASGLGAGIYGGLCLRTRTKSPPV